MKRFCFFDLDGTLADTDPDIRVSWKAAMKDLGLVYPDFDRDFIAGPTLEEMAKRFFPNVYTDELGARLRERFGFHYDNDGFPTTVEYPGVIEAARRMRNAGRRLFIVTNKRYAGACAMARHFGWNDVFEKIYTSDMHKDDPSIGKLRKPQLLALVMRELGAAPEECVMIGDTVNDFEAAKANGIESVAVRWGYGTPSECDQATFSVSDAEGLSDLLLGR